ncbi:MAG: hypothetical protein CMH27_06390 [Micavibrio sp.]|nr:hypothetical protein [Micavibrio sp.]|tara:strand:- start:4287 stop:4895 length:609 start_codon:yes stop_codon:yes gene_type:complete
MLNFVRCFSVCVFVLAFIWLAGLTFYTVKIIAAKPVQSTKKTEAIIVLTGGNYRIETGMQLWSQNLAQELFITGVYKNVTRRDILEEWQGKMRLPHCCLTLGYKAQTTEENAREVKDWVDDNYIRSARLVTSKYHMPRALFEFHILMPDLDIIPHPVEIEDYPLNHPVFWRLALLEYHKMLVRQFEHISGLRFSRNQAGAPT